MTLKIGLKLLTSKVKHIGISFLGIFGLIWLFFEPAGLFFPDQLSWGWAGYIGLLISSLVLAILFNMPRLSFERALSSPDTTIALKIGDLFDEPGHLVIGANDVFDTELGDIIKPSSVQGQFLTIVYHGDQRLLDADIQNALGALHIQGIQESNKLKGKTVRYPIGTTPVLGKADKKYFLSAYGSMGNDLRVKATADGIWLSLSTLWEQVRKAGHGTEIAIPVVGSDLARTNLPRKALTKLIMLSFIAASKEGFVSKKLTIMIHPKDLGLVDLNELEDFLDSACF